MLESLPIARLRFDLTAKETTDVPPYKGDLLRMALLWWLSEFWCPMPTRCRHGCERPDVCMFGQLCTPPVDPAWSKATRALVGDTPPPAYALWDMQDRRTRFGAGTAWSFEMTLIGELAGRQIPAIVAAIQQGAEGGMGRVRLRSDLERVTALAVLPEGGGHETILADRQSGGDLTWHSYRLGDVSSTYGITNAWMARGRTQGNSPPRSLSVRFLSPVKIKERGQWVIEPRFDAIAKALVRRLRILSEVHGSGEWPHAEYGPLLDTAETVELSHHETFWTGYTRRSKTAGPYEVEGLLGQAWYAGEAPPELLAILWFGQWLHLGKGYVSGSGRYSVIL
jgi:hypothetical protein